MIILRARYSGQPILRLHKYVNMEVSGPRRSLRTSAAQKDAPIPLPTAKPRKRKSPVLQGSDVDVKPTKVQRASLPDNAVNDVVEKESKSQPGDGPKTPIKTPKKARTAAIQKTNAPLQTPGGTRLIRLPTAPTDVAATSNPDSSHLTSENLLETAKAHLLAVDPTLAKVINAHHCNIFDAQGLSEVIEPFAALSSGIIGQQVSGAAATSIKNKFIGLFELSGAQKAAPKPFPSPSQVAAMDIPTMRTAGLSQRKAEYIHGLAEKFASGELSAQMLLDANDEDLIEKLVAVRGLGRWSVEMFACFALKRMDVFSTGDLGVQKGCAVYRGRDVAKLRNKGGKWKYMTEADMLDTAAPFVPYRSLFMWYMWKFADTDVGALK